MLGRKIFDQHNRETLPQDAQKDRPARPQPMNAPEA
jgi:hypothetical protein